MTTPLSALRGILPLWVLVVLATGCAGMPDMRPPAPTPTDPPTRAQVPAPEPVPEPQPRVEPTPETSRVPAPSIARQEPAREERTRTQQPPAVLALASDADERMKRGDADGAAAALERALRIAPDDARLWQRLAAVRLEQGQPEQAVNLAGRSNTLARGDQALQARNWRIIAEARRRMGDHAGANAAEERARSLAPGELG
ncbi:tetratricopeptide repeat protein [Ectothiorhodospira variabilis]|nr:tetratricopeptide repeat protein [Ectothiorhodospira variabilis]MCG5493771.1 tetratricopeptide repeat protein [Ectothiorhodospira variabilis]MCG5503970.1 tetratricopeptide repeat protein [Ectothiorhodospira variabilis]MCG5507125.1 tetratricopeptide repeat protein [Ectothiorhodospira variabilis]